MSRIPYSRWDRGESSSQRNFKSTKNDEYTPVQDYEKPINANGIWLNLDCVKDIDRAIELWAKTTHLTAALKGWNSESTYAFVMHTFQGNVAQWWRNTTSHTQDTVKYTEAGIANKEWTTVTIMLANFEKAIRDEFLGENWSSLGNELKTKKIEEAKWKIANLIICDMCLIDNYICEFSDYFYAISPLIGETKQTYLDLFMQKLP